MIKRIRNQKALIAFLITAFLLISFISSCNNFMSGDDDLKAAIEDEVLIANAEEVTITVRAESDSMGTTSPLGAAIVKVGVPFNITTTTNSEFAFLNWMQIGGNSGDITFTNAASKETTATVNKKTSNLEIRAMFDTRPYVVSTAPYDNEQEVIITRPIKITFSRPVDINTATQSNIIIQRRLSGSSSDPDPINSFFEDPVLDGSVLTLNLKSDNFLGTTDAYYEIFVTILQQIEDLNGNTMTAGKTVRFVTSKLKDTEPPTVLDITVKNESGTALPVNNPTNSRNILLNFEVGDNSGSTELKALIKDEFDNTLYNNTHTNNIPVTLPDIDGNRTISVIVYDPSNNPSLTKTANIILDRQPPDTPAFTPSPPAALTNSPLSFTVSGADNGLSGIKEYKVTAGASGVVDPSTNGVFTDITPAAQGNNTITIAAYDKAGNVSLTALTAEVVYDSIPPGTPETLTKSESYLNINTTSMTITAPLASSGAVEDDTISLLIDGAVKMSDTLTAAEVTGNYIFTLNSATFGTDGTKQITARVTDKAGNPGGLSAQLEITKDTEKPVITISSPANGAYVNGTQDISFTGSEGTVEVQINSGSWQPFASGNSIDSITSFDGLSSGPFTVGIRATDTAGNVSDIAARNFFKDTMPPTVSNVTTTTETGTYPAGTEIPIKVNFSEAVTVTGTPYLTLALSPGNKNIGLDDPSGSGTTALSFTYTVAAGDTSADLNYASTSALVLNGGTIKDTAGNNATLTLPALASAESLGGTTKNIVIDAVLPTVSSVTTTKESGSYPAGTEIPITVNFSKAVTVTGTPYLTLALSSGNKNIGLDDPSGSGTTALSFTYTVAAGDTSADLNYASTSALVLNGGTIKDSIGNNATLTLPALASAESLGGTTKNIVIDAVLPTVSSVTTTKESGSYPAGTEIPITVNFSKAVTVTGTPYLTLALSSGNKNIGLDDPSGSGTTALSFTYTVAAGDTSADLNYASTSALVLNGGTIKDSIGNNANLTLPALDSDESLGGTTKNIKIDTTAPTVSSVTTTKESGSYPAGTEIPITVNFPEAVTVTGTPYLTLALSSGNKNIGLDDPSGSGTTALSFTYTVAAGDTSADLNYASTSALVLNGGTIKDTAGNNANLTLPALDSDESLGGTTKNIKIDTTAPTVSNVTTTTETGTYPAGTEIPIKVNFPEAVTVTGTPYLTLALSSGNKNISYTSGSDTSALTFSYTVAAGDTTSDLNYASTAALVLNGGTIKDAASNNANLALPALDSDESLGGTTKDIIIEGILPTLTGTFVFTNPSTATLTSVPVTSLTVADTTSLSAYIVTIETTAPAYSAETWETLTGTSQTLTSVNLASATTDGADKAFYLYVRDSAGNVTKSNSATITVDTTAPEINTGASSPSASSANNKLTITLSSAEVSGIRIIYYWPGTGTKAQAITDGTVKTYTHATAVKTGSLTTTTALDVSVQEQTFRFSVADDLGNETSNGYQMTWDTDDWTYGGAASRSAGYTENSITTSISDYTSASVRNATTRYSKHRVSQVETTEPYSGITQNQVKSTTSRKAVKSTVQVAGYQFDSGVKGVQTVSSVNTAPENAEASVGMNKTTQGTGENVSAVNEIIQVSSPEHAASIPETEKTVFNKKMTVSETPEISAAEYFKNHIALMALLFSTGIMICAYLYFRRKYLIKRDEK